MSVPELRTTIHTIEVITLSAITAKPWSRCCLPDLRLSAMPKASPSGGIEIART